MLIAGNVSVFSNDIALKRVVCFRLGKLFIIQNSVHVNMTNVLSCNYLISLKIKGTFPALFRLLMFLFLPSKRLD